MKSWDVGLKMVLNSDIIKHEDDVEELFFELKEELLQVIRHHIDIEEESIDYFKDDPIAIREHQ